MTYWTLECGGVERAIADWGIDQVSAKFVSQGEDRCELMAKGRAFDAAELFPYQSTVVIRRDRVLGSGFSGGSIYFTGLVAYPTLSGAARGEAQACAVIGPWWYLQQRGYEQEYKQVFEWVGTPGGVASTVTRRGSRILLNQTVDLVNHPDGKLTTGEQCVDILNWVLKPFTDRAVAAPFQFDAEALAAALDVDPPVDEVINLTCEEALRKMLRWSPDAVTWFDYSTTPPTFHVARRADLTAFALNLASQPPTRIECKPRYDLQRPFVRVQYEITDTIDGISVPYTLEKVWPDPPPSGVMDEFGGVPFVVNLQGNTVSTLRSEIETRDIDETSQDWWLANLPEMAFGIERGSIKRLTIDPTSVSLRADDGEEYLELPRQLVAGTPVDWMRVGGNPAQFQKVKALAKAVIEYGNGGIDHDAAISFQFTATDASTGTYSGQETLELADAIPVNLERDFFDAISVLQYEGRLFYHEQEVGGLPRLGHKLNLLGTARAGLASMNAVVQRVTENVFSGQTTVEFGPPPHLSLDDLVALFRVTRNRSVVTPSSVRNSGRFGAGKGSLTAHSARANSSNAGGSAQTLVASGSPRPDQPTSPEASGVITLNGLARTIQMRDVSGSNLLIELSKLAGKAMEIREEKFQDPTAACAWRSRLILSTVPVPCAAP